MLSAVIIMMAKKWYARYQMLSKTCQMSDVKIFKIMIDFEQNFPKKEGFSPSNREQYNLFFLLSRTGQLYPSHQWRPEEPRPPIKLCTHPTPPNYDPYKVPYLQNLQFFMNIWKKILSNCE